MQYRNIFLLWACSLTLNTPAITMSEFIKLPQAQKITAFSSLSEKEKQQLAKANKEMLTQHKSCPGGYLENVSLEGLNLIGGNLDNITLKNVTLTNCNLSQASLNNALIIDGSITGCNFLQASLERAVIAGSNPDNPITIATSNFTKAKLNQTKIIANFKQCIVDEAQLVGSLIRQSNFDAATTLKKANLQWISTDFVGFHGNLMQADFRNSLLKETDFAGATLTQASFDDATIIFTQFANATIDGATLNGTNFVYGVSFKGANLAKAAINNTNFKGAQFCRTLMPDGKINNDNCDTPTVLHEWQADQQVVENNKKTLLATNHCINCYLGGADLRGHNLSNADLQGSWLDEADLRGATLSNAQLQRANLQGATIDKSTNFSGAFLCNTAMPKDLYPVSQQFRTDQCGKTPPQSIVKAAAAAATPAADAKKTLLATKSCTGCDLSYADLINQRLDEFNLAQAKLIGANLTSVHAVKANFEQAQMPEATITNGIFDQAQLSRANLNSSVSKGPHTSFHLANLSGANLSEAQWAQVTLAAANLTKADLSLTNLTQANLDGAQLTNAQCQRTNFSKATLTNVNAQGTLFAGANFTDANLTGMVTNQATNFTGAIFCRTIMPDGKQRTDNCQ